MSKARAIFLGYTERPYTGRDGQQRVARNVSLQVEGEGAGQVFVGNPDLVEKVKRLKAGTVVELDFGLSLYRGEFQARLADVSPVAGS